MVKLSDIEKILNETNIRYEEINLSLVNDDMTIIPPYIAWYENEPTVFCADGEIYHTDANVTFELVATLDDHDSELKVETVLRNHEIIYSKDISYIEEASVKSVSFDFEVMDDRFED